MGTPTRKDVPGARLGSPRSILARVAPKPNAVGREDIVDTRMLSRLRELLGGDGTARQRAAEEGRWEQLLRSGEQTVVDHLAPSVLVEEPDCFQVGDVKALRAATVNHYP
jgi:hypothetical protein